jgi:hypothetical protein
VLFLFVSRYKIYVSVLNVVINYCFGWQYHIFHNLIPFITVVYSSVDLSINFFFLIIFYSPNKYINKCYIHAVYLFIYLFVAGV